MLTRDEQRIVRAAGGFLRVIEHQGDLTFIAGWPFEGGCTAPDDLRSQWPGCHIWYSAKGVRLYYSTPSDPRQLIELVRWRSIQAHGSRLPDSLRLRIRDHLRARVAHQVTFRSYPNRSADPEGWDEADRYFREAHMPEFVRLQDERRTLLDEVYPLTVDHEPTDLLELLAVTG